MDLFDAILLARIQFASLHQGNLGRYCQLADRRPGEAGALFPWGFSLGAFPWRYAAIPGSAIPRQATIASERSTRSSDDDMAWRGQLWRLATPSWMETNRWRCRADVNRFMIHFMILLRRRVGRCAFSARHRTASWLTMIPRAASRSLTILRLGGKRIESQTACWMTSAGNR